MNREWMPVANLDIPWIYEATIKKKKCGAIKIMIVDTFR
jgi:hypothetical protein